ncbi:MAG: NADH-quinone oxidoreductase subunit NuoN [Acidimicrobiia bacterium]|nr:NADH-quinone oxidoreductase subunit NuoN [Acidimicrobiia bacterium]
MNFEIDYVALAPELIVAATIVAGLIVDLLLVRRNKYWVAVLSIVGVTGALVPIVYMLVDGSKRSMFNGSYVVDEFALILKVVFLVAGYLVLLMSVSYIESDRYYQGEYYFLLLSSILGSVVLSSARDLLILFIGIELTTGPLFLLSGWRKGDAKSNEAALKFFILGVLSTAILLYGMSLLFGLTGSIEFAAIAEAIPEVASEPALVIAVLFLIVGFGFKISAVPFHFWAPDTYEGAPTPVAAYLSVNSKAAGFVAMLIVMYTALPAVSDVWAPALWILAAASMTVGNLAALRQSNIVRLLAYSSIAQAGFMMVPFAAAAVADSDLEQAFSATVVYMVIYALMNLGAFAVVIAGARRTGSGEIDDWAGLGRKDAVLGILAALFFLSLAGIPPLAGWYAKFVMFASVIEGGGTWTLVLAGFAAVNSVIAFYYYARVIKAVWLDAPSDELMARPALGYSGSIKLSLAIAIGLTVAIGIYPTFATYFGEASRVIATGG